MFWGSLYICIFSYDRFGRLTLFLGGTSFSCVIYAKTALPIGLPGL